MQYKTTKEQNWDFETFLVSPMYASVSQSFNLKTFIALALALFFVCRTTAVKLKSNKSYSQ